MKIKLRYQLLLLCFLVLAAYYPVLLAGYNPIDDTKMLSAWTERNLGDLWGYFFRRPRENFLLILEQENIG